MRAAGRIEHRSYVSSDSHKSSCCPHALVGAHVSGSANVLINKSRALRVGDKGVHFGCCGSNRSVAISGASHVLINNRPAHRVSDTQQHCGGIGQLAEGSKNVLVGSIGDRRSSGMQGHVLHRESLSIRVRFHDGEPVRNRRVVASGIGGSHSAVLSHEGTATIENVQAGWYHIEIDGLPYISIPTVTSFVSSPGVSDDD